MQKTQFKQLLFTGRILLISFLFGGILCNCTSAEAEPTLTDYGTVSVPSVDATLSDSFMRGFDASEIRQAEEKGITFYDEDNTAKDPLVILKEHGVNWIRLRIWNSPSEKDPGACNYERTLNVAKRAKALGLKLLLDFHYSDTWADPGHQQIPAAWENYTAITDVTKAVYDYTYKIVSDLKAAGAEPDMVQIGNEINSGMFLKKSDNKTDTPSSINCTTSTDTGRKNLAWVLESGIKAVHDADSSIIVAPHLSTGGNPDTTKWFFDFYATHSGTAATVETVDFDAIGLSYYCFWNAKLCDLQTNIANLKSRYGKEVFVAETSYAWTLDWNDNSSNMFSAKQETDSYWWLVDSSNKLWKNIDVLTRSDGSTKYIPATVQNQANVVRAVIEASAQKGATGVFYWGGGWMCVSAVGDSWENQALFGFDGKCLPGMNVFNVKGK